jgi:RNA:NAD 2'-phosphotransferase (TPT1/KptA family)
MKRFGRAPVRVPCRKQRWLFAEDRKGRGVDKRLIRVSRYLAKYLRHAPDELGLTLQPGGWVPVDDLLDAACRDGSPIAYEELVECVETNDKRRFSFDETGDLIRANQGHSVDVDLHLDEVKRLVKIPGTWGAKITGEQSQERVAAALRWFKES